MAKAELRGWLARDRNGLVYFYKDKPTMKRYGKWMTDDGFSNFYSFPNEASLSDMTETDDKPVKCKITIEYDPL